MAELQQAAAFLNALGGGTFIFQTFTDQKDLVPKGKRDPLASVLIGSFEDHSAALSRLNAAGAGIFVQINEGKERGKDHVTNIRAIFIDLDVVEVVQHSLAELRSRMPPPSIITNSSAGKYHLYWVAEGLSVEKFTSVQKSLAIKFGGDDSIGNKDRVMRLPGFMHRKGAAQLVKSKIFDLNYTAKEVVAAISKADCLIELPDAPVKRKAKASTDCFGLDIGDGYEEPEAVGKGGRVTELVRHVGKLVSEGWGLDEVEARLRKFNQETCNPPVDDARFEREVMPSVASFHANRQAEISLPVPPPPPVPAPPTKGSDEVPAPPVVEKPSMTFPPPCTLTTAAQQGLMSEALNPDMYSTENWQSRFVLIAEKNRIGDRCAGSNSVFKMEDFKSAMSAVVVDKALMFNKWKDSKERIVVRDETYHPTSSEFVIDENQLYLNTYRPSRISPVINFDIAKTSTFLELVEVFCPEAYNRDTLLDWLACTYANPEVRIQWAPILLSKPGAGKSLILSILRLIMGTSNCKMILHDRLTKDFNGFLYESTLVIIDEMETSDDRQLIKLKSYITESRLEINLKGIQEGDKNIYPSIMIFTNKEDAVHIEDDDRRFWVAKAGDVREQAFYTKVDSWRDSGDNIAHLMGFLKHRAANLKHNWHMNRPSFNRATDIMRDTSKSEFELSFSDAVNSREGAFAADVTCFKSVKDYMELRLDQNLSTSESRILAMLLNKVTCKLPKWDNVRLPLKMQGQTFRHRPKCLRNSEQWNLQPKDTVIHEMNRSHQLASGRSDVEPPMMKLIKGDI